MIGRQMKASLAGVQGAIGDDEAELQHALATRDILIASINALSDQLEQAYESNAARLLDAKTLDAIQAQYNLLRQSLLTRAQAVAKLAQDAFNFERDAEFALVKDAYYDPDRKGYTAAETLLHDLGGLDHIDLTGRTQKALQLTQMVSLKKHQPMSFLALAMTGRARFTTELAAFDRWYPGTYLQRIKEVRSRFWSMASSRKCAATSPTTGRRWSASPIPTTSARSTMSASSPSPIPTSPGSATSACSGVATSTRWRFRPSTRSSPTSGWASCRTASAISSRMSGWKAPGSSSCCPISHST
jgi:hypothetical protein